MQDKYYLSDTIVFEPKPIAVPYNYRISYRVAQIILIIYYCCSARSGSSLIKINIISDILSSNEKYQDYRINNMAPIVRFDPAVTKALNFAIAEGLIVQIKNGNYKLSDSGKNYANEVVVQTDLMQREKEILSQISKNITEKRIKDIMSEWRYDNA